MTTQTCRVAVAETVSILRAIYPGFRLLDLSFPALDFFWLHEDTAAFLNAETIASPAALEFFRRFRQAGGHQPIGQLADLPSYLAASPARQTTLLACRASDCASLAEALRKPHANTALLVSGAEDCGPLEQIGFHAWLTFRFIRPSATETIHLLSPTEPPPDSVARIAAAAASFAIGIRAKPQPKIRPGSLITITLPAEGFRPPTAAFTPHRLIHDGSRVSEGNAKYSWLWVGPERHIRFLFGEIPAHFRNVRVIVPNAHGTANLQSAKLLLNGILAPTSVEIWDEGAGAVSTSLPPGTQVIGFSVRNLTRLEDGAQLAASIDKIEFS